MADEADTGEGTKFEGEFDAARAARLIENLRAEAKTAKERAAAYEKAAQERADAEKSELQKAIERAERAERDLQARAKADTERAALRESGLDPDLADILAITDPRERATKLAEKLASKPATAGDDEGEETEPATVATKPRPRLTPGHRTAGPDGVLDAKGIEELAERLYRNR